MAFFIGLLAISSFSWLIGLTGSIPYLKAFPNCMKIAVAILFVIIGFMHLLKPEKFLYMLTWTKYAPACVLISGVLEILFGLSLFVPSLQTVAAWGIIILLVLMFPANSYVAIKQLPAPGGLPAKPWYTWSRLLFQPIYILWVYYAAILPLAQFKAG